MLHAVVVMLVVSAAAMKVDAAVDEPRYRQPVALDLSAGGKWLFVANRTSGSVSVVDTVAMTVAKEIDVGGRLSDLAAFDDKHVLALDEGNHQLLLLGGGGSEWTVVAKLDVPPYPRRLHLDRASRLCFISSLWSRAVTIVDLAKIGGEPQPRLVTVQQIALPFEPQEMCLAKDGQVLLVAGAFRGMLAAIDIESAAVVDSKKIRGHNIRGLAINEDDQQLYLTRQELIPLAHSTRDDVHWGNMISNLLVSMSIEELCDPQLGEIKAQQTYYLGQPGNAAGDPGPVTIEEDGDVAILLAGVHEIALGSQTDLRQLRRVRLGSGPSDVVSSDDGRLFVANRFSDTISVVDIAKARQLSSVPLGRQRELTPAERGEMLFYDSRLSHDGWMSCHSCHTDGHTSGQLNDNLSDGSFGAPKRVLSLLGVADTAPWAWNGQLSSLEEQVQNSITKTMQGDALEKTKVAALTAYLKSLPPPPTASISADAEQHTQLKRGEELFHALNCQRCHTPPNYTTPLAYDTGLHDEVGNTRFNPPSLRGAAHRDAFFHDARATSLADVLVKHKHQLKRELTPSETDALLHFLMSL
jgi:YVTN family beta-propeller protein